MYGPRNNTFTSIPAWDVGTKPSLPTLKQADMNSTVLQVQRGHGHQKGLDLPIHYKPRKLKASSSVLLGLKAHKYNILM